MWSQYVTCLFLSVVLVLPLPAIVAHRNLDGKLAQQELAAAQTGNEPVSVPENPEKAGPMADKNRGLISNIFGALVSGASSVFGSLSSSSSPYQPSPYQSSPSQSSPYQSSPSQSSPYPSAASPFIHLVQMLTGQPPPYSPQQYPQQTPQQYPQQTPQQYPQQTPQQYHQQTPQQYPQQNPQQNPLAQQEPQGQCGQQAPGFEPVIQDSNARIINGFNANPHSWPWQVALHIGGSLCGGTIIAPDVVLTAAHCFKGGKSGDIDVFAGAHHLFGQGDPEAVRVKGRAMPNQLYGTNGEGNDIALVKLAQPLTYNKYIQPICLPPPDQDPPPNSQCTISGWGRTKFTQDSGPNAPSYLPEVLQQASVPILDDATCKQNPQLAAKLQDMMMCAGGGSTDTCQGDSGGPLVCKVGQKWVQYGVTSWGFACGTPGYPGVYTRVSRYIDWINQMTRS